MHNVIVQINPHDFPIGNHMRHCDCVLVQADESLAGQDMAKEAIEVIDLLLNESNRSVWSLSVLSMSWPTTPSDRTIQSYYPWSHSTPVHGM